ncbi:hypothetical protein [Kordia sp.]|uniref:hypothetical protein n=1 Tax=Kordia sp. TaxID=1965332 RepID=UPI003D2B4B8B
MNTHAAKTQKNATQTVASRIVQKKGTAFEFEDNRPEAVVQQKIKELQNKKATQLQGKHTTGCGCASCVSQLAEKNNSETIQKQSKEIVQLVNCPHGKQKHKCKACQQSIDARNANKVRRYQTPHKDEQKQKAREDAVKGKKGSVAHGFGKKGSKQSGKMDQILKDVNEKGGKGGKGKKGKKGK